MNPISGLRNLCGSTRFKVALASLVYRVIRLFRMSPSRVVRRAGVRFDLDLREGIDMSIFLFGGFQKHVSANPLVSLSAAPVIFDVGANIGAICLPMAQAHPRARVYAFEPTAYAYGRLLRNLELNPDLAERVFPVNSFVSSTVSDASTLTAFSSWPIDGRKDMRHPVHLGVAKEGAASQVTLDAFMEAAGLEALDFIKIDTDGHELDVLKGARAALERFHPAIVFEVAPYLLAERGIRLADFQEVLEPIGYSLREARTSKKIDDGNLAQLVSDQGGTDILAVCDRR